LKVIHFIINPIAGSGNHNLSLSVLEKYFNSKIYSIKVKFSNYKGHSQILAQESINENADIVVACGGDGTINEVARSIVNSNKILGIIPIGSGNGLASNLNIPKNIEKATDIIKSKIITCIDVGKINSHYFFSNMGIGFDAKVVREYETSTNRKLLGYAKATLKALKKFKTINDIDIELNNRFLSKNLFMLFVSNSNELGYNLSLTPKASLQDGLLDVFLVSKINKLQMVTLSLLIMLKKQSLLKQVETYQTKKITIQAKSNETFATQIDGEYLKINTKKIEISILQKSLNILAPN